jgi:hypothetical protein
MVIAVLLRNVRRSSTLRYPMDVEIQSRQTQFDLGRIHTKTLAGHGRIDSAFTDP